MIDRETGYDTETDRISMVEEAEQELDDARLVLDFIEVYDELGPSRVLYLVSRFINDGGTGETQDQAEGRMLDAEVRLRELGEKRET